MDKIQEQIMSIMEYAESVRREKKITQKKLSELSGSGYRTWHIWLTGSNCPTLYPLLSCLHALGLDLDLCYYKGDDHE